MCARLAGVAVRVAGGPVQVDDEACLGILRLLRVEDIRRGAAHPTVGAYVAVVKVGPPFELRAAKERR